MNKYRSCLNGQIIGEVSFVEGGARPRRGLEEGRDAGGDESPQISKPDCSMTVDCEQTTGDSSCTNEAKEDCIDDTRVATSCVART